MESITEHRLERLLRETKACRPVSLATITDPDMLKRNNPFSGVARKVSFVTGFINWHYARVVNRQRVREGKAEDFVAQPRKWGQRIKGTPLVAHVAAGDGAVLHYLELKVQNSHAHYFNRNTGERIDIESLKPFFPKRPADTKQELEQPVILRDYRLDRIAEITLNGVRYAVTPAVSELQTYFSSQVPATPELLAIAAVS